MEAPDQMAWFLLSLTFPVSDMYFAPSLTASERTRLVSSESNLHPAFVRCPIQYSEVWRLRG